MNVDQFKDALRHCSLLFKNGEVDYDAYTKWWNVRLPAGLISS